MCGRFTLTIPVADLAALFGVSPEEALEPRYNIAPTQSVLVVRQLPVEPKRRIDRLRWGLIPSWAKDASIGNRMINARAETLVQKPSFREAYKRHRGLIPATGFFEWKKEGKKKQPYYISPASGGILAFAGLWERWHDPEGDLVESCTIVTTAANEFMQEYHHRMPAIIQSADFDRWLDPDNRDTSMLTHLLVPCADDLLTARVVGSLVNDARRDGAGVLE